VAVDDIDAARDELLAHGVEVHVFHDAAGGLGGGFYAGSEKRSPGPDPQRRSYASYASFSDPDGNRWLLQEIKERLPRRASRRVRGARPAARLVGLVRGVHGCPRARQHPGGGLRGRPSLHGGRQAHSRLASVTVAAVGW
jgi:hypothetical protein